MNGGEYKKVLLIAVLVVAIVAVYFKDFSGPVIKEMKGGVTEVRGDSILVEGTIDGQNKIIEFKLTEETILEKSALILLPRDKAGGGWYEPERKDVAGQLSDLKSGVQILEIRSRQNLNRTDKAEALFIKYNVYEPQN